MYSPLQYLFIKYPDKFKDIDVEIILENPNTTNEIIKNNLKIHNINWYQINYYMYPVSYLNYRHYWYEHFKQKHSLDMIKLFPTDKWRVYLYSSFIKENINKYSIRRFLPMDMSFGNINDILYILKKYPNPRWRLKTLSVNPKLTMEIVKNNMDIKWNWKYLSFNSNITMKDIEDNLDIPWNWVNVLYNPNISIEIFKLFQFSKWAPKNEHFDLIYESLRIKPEIINYIIDNYNTDKLDYSQISNSVTIDTIKKYPNKDWNWVVISSSQYITMNDIEDNINLQWRWFSISINQNLTIEFIKKHINSQLDWAWMSRNPGITIKDIENNLELPWEYESISRNPNLTIDFIEKNIDKSWNWLHIARNHFITDIRINAINKICSRWKVRNTRYKLEHKYRLKFVRAELETLQPFKTDNFDFKGGIAYIDAGEHFNSIKN